LNDPIEVAKCIHHGGGFDEQLAPCRFRGLEARLRAQLF